ncbi:hypothetical protein [Adhaeribacter soli]|uniref:Uncharacterized protein n=1 Tax=Adhaeribacter soli TaxID=2607655 RepID=A0A5N1INZ8_9BACT|nr:hypothetical protein [Adhaeribacter soli]KAA9325210.1 hypothetical protein F0P94_18470 [Adhaeribacter soli]
MNTQQLRNLLIDKISSIRDVKYLMAIKTILDTNFPEQEPYKLTDAQRKKVRTGLEQLKNGEITSNEDLEKEEDEWLNE